jgi:hypothetical protein
MRTAGDKRELRERAARDEEAARQRGSKQSKFLPERLTLALLRNGFADEPLFLTGPDRRDPFRRDRFFSDLALRPPSHEHALCFRFFMSLSTTSAENRGLRAAFLRFRAAASDSGPSLCWVLSVLRNEAHYDLSSEDDPSTSGAVDDVVFGLALAAEKGWFTSPLTDSEARHMLSLSLILSHYNFELCYEALDKVLDAAGGASLSRLTFLTSYMIPGRAAASILCDWLRRPTPARGCITGRLTQVLVGERREGIADHSWVTAADVTAACAALTLVLDDPCSSDETNGWVFHAIFSLMERMPHHAQLAWELCGEAVRRADAADRVDTSQCGGADRLLYAASCSVWLATRTSEEHLPPFRFTLTNGVYVQRDADGYSFYDPDAWKEQPESWRVLAGRELALI